MTPSPNQTARRGDWFQTYTGKQFYPLDPRPAEICIEDIAHHLSMICRWGGAVKNFYSVAQHAVFVSRLVPKKSALLALMHDAPEAYTGCDLMRPLKRGWREFEIIERRIWNAVALKFKLKKVSLKAEGSLTLELSDKIKRADNVALATERRDLMYPGQAPLHPEERKYVPSTHVLNPLNSLSAEHQFLERFADLTGELIIPERNLHRQARFQMIGRTHRPTGGLRPS